MSSPGTELHQMASIGRLFSAIVHEINTPLGSIFCNNETILRSLAKVDGLLADARPESIESARRIVANCLALAGVDQLACQHLRSIIRGLKRFSRLDPAERERVDLNVQLRDTLKLTEAEFRGRVEVTTDFGELPPVECYPRMLSQVFLNLLMNAGQAIEGQGRIAVRTRLENGQVHVSVADTGCGIDPQQKNRIFQPGFTTKPVGEGCGLGLSIAREIIEEKHGGSIQFESETGLGTTFHVRIPVASERSFER